LQPPDKPSLAAVDLLRKQKAAQDKQRREIELKKIIQGKLVTDTLIAEEKISEEELDIRNKKTADLILVTATQEKKRFDEQKATFTETKTQPKPKEIDLVVPPISKKKGLIQKLTGAATGVASYVGSFFGATTVPKTIVLKPTVENLAGISEEKKEEYAPDVVYKDLMLSPKLQKVKPLPSIGQITVTSSVMPQIDVPIPKPVRIKFLKSLLPHIYKVLPLHPIIESKVYGYDNQTKNLFSSRTKKRSEHISAFITITIQPDRFDFTVQPGFSPHGFEEMVGKIFHHLKSLGANSKVILQWLRPQNKHKTLLSHKQLLNASIHKLRATLQKVIKLKMRTVARITLHQRNVLGGSLFSVSIHHPFYKKYFR
jgi:hypothetical protein